MKSASLEYDVVAEVVTEIVRKLLDDHFATVHILQGGYPLCGFCIQLPSSWPRGHTWISHLDDTSRATCEDCQRELKAQSPS